MYPVTDVALKQSWERLRNRDKLIEFTFHDLINDAISKMFAKRIECTRCCIYQWVQESKSVV